MGTISPVKKVKYINDSFNLTESNFLLYAAKNYDNPQCTELDEFLSDLQVPLHLKKLFTRYSTHGILKDRLILNHVISFFNVFSPFAACKILFFKLDSKHYKYLKTVLIYLNRCPDYVYINGQLLNIEEMEIDEVLLKRLDAI